MTREQRAGLLYAAAVVFATAAVVLSIYAGSTGNVALSVVAGPVVAVALGFAASAGAALASHPPGER